MRKGPRMWWRKQAPTEEVVDQQWSDAVKRCLATKVTYFPLIHPENDIPSEKLRCMEQFFPEPQQSDKNDVLALMRSIVVKGDPYEAQVLISNIRGVFHSKGTPKFNIYKLPETMDLSDKSQTGPESFGPLSELQIKRLDEDLHSPQAGIYDDQSRMKLDLQTWDNVYVVSNSYSHSRRVALWCRLQAYHGKANGAPPPQPDIRAIVQPISLDQNLVSALQNRYRLVFLEESELVSDAIAAVSALDPNVAYFPATEPYLPAMISFPLFNAEVLLRNEGLFRLHRWVDGLFDLGRYIFERQATYNLRHS